jgi:hypothetical protein
MKSSVIYSLHFKKEFSLIMFAKRYERSHN